MLLLNLFQSGSMIFLELSPLHNPLFVTKLKIPPFPSLSPGYQFCTVEYFTSAFFSATISTIAAWKLIFISLRSSTGLQGSLHNSLHRQPEVSFQTDLYLQNLFWNMLKVPWDIWLLLGYSRKSHHWKQLSLMLQKSYQYREQRNPCNVSRDLDITWTKASLKEQKIIPISARVSLKGCL